MRIYLYIGHCASNVKRKSSGSGQELKSCFWGSKLRGASQVAFSGFTLGFLRLKNIGIGIYFADS
jgi:hypothetical protein